MTTLNRELTASGPYLLEIDSDSVDVDILIEDRCDFLVTLTSDDDTPEIRQAMDRASLTGGRRATELKLYGPRYSSRSNVSFGYQNGTVQYNTFGGATFRALSAEVRVPQGVELTIETVSGDVRTNGYVKRVWVRSTSGDVRVHQCARLDAKTKSGDLTAHRVDEDVLVRSASGNVDLGTVGKADVNSVSGDIYIENMLQAGWVKSTSGDIQIRFAQGNTAASSTSGDLDVPSHVAATTVSGRVRKH